jgi:hypothetical protein
VITTIELKMVCIFCDLPIINSFAIIKQNLFTLFMTIIAVGDTIWFKRKPVTLTENPMNEEINSVQLVDKLGATA